MRFRGPGPAPGGGWKIMAPGMRRGKRRAGLGIPGGYYPLPGVRVQDVGLHAELVERHFFALPRVERPRLRALLLMGDRDELAFRVVELGEVFVGVVRTGLVSRLAPPGIPEQAAALVVGVVVGHETGGVGLVPDPLGEALLGVPGVTGPPAGRGRVPLSLRKVVEQNHAHAGPRVLQRLQRDALVTTQCVNAPDGAYPADGHRLRPILRPQELVVVHREGRHIRRGVMETVADRLEDVALVFGGGDVPPETQNRTDE